MNTTSFHTHTISCSSLAGSFTSTQTENDLGHPDPSLGQDRISSQPHKSESAKTTPLLLRAISRVRNGNSGVQAENALSSAKVKICRLELELSQFKMENGALNTTNQNYLSEITRYQSEIRELQAERSFWKEQSLHWQQQTCQLQEAHNCAMSECVELQISLRAGKREYEQVSSLLKDRQQEQEDVQAAVQRMSAQLLISNNNTAETQGKLRVANDEISALKEMVGVLMRTVEEKDIALSHSTSARSGFPSFGFSPRYASAVCRSPSHPLTRPSQKLAVQSVPRTSFSRTLPEELSISSIRDSCATPSISPSLKPVARVKIGTTQLSAQAQTRHIPSSPDLKVCIPESTSLEMQVPSIPYPERKFPLLTSNTNTDHIRKSDVRLPEEYSSLACSSEFSLVGNSKCDSVVGHPNGCGSDTVLQPNIILPGDLTDMTTSSNSDSEDHTSQCHLSSERYDVPISLVDNNMDRLDCVSNDPVETK